MYTASMHWPIAEYLEGLLVLPHVVLLTSGVCEGARLEYSISSAANQTSTERTP